MRHGVTALPLLLAALAAGMGMAAALGLGRGSAVAAMPRIVPQDLAACNNVPPICTRVQQKLQPHMDRWTAQAGSGGISTAQGAAYCGNAATAEVMEVCAEAYATAGLPQCVQAVLAQWRQHMDVLPGHLNNFVNTHAVSNPDINAFCGFDARAVQNKRGITSKYQPGGACKLLGTCDGIAGTNTGRMSPGGYVPGSGESKPQDTSAADAALAEKAFASVLKDLPPDPPRSSPPRTVPEWGVGTPPKNVKARELRIAAQKAFEQRDWPAAENALRDALDLEPDNATTHSKLAAALYAQRRFVEAKALLDAFPGPVPAADLDYRLGMLSELNYVLQPETHAYRPFIRSFPRERFRALIAGYVAFLRAYTPQKIQAEGCQSFARMLWILEAEGMAADTFPAAAIGCAQAHRTDAGARGYYMSRRSIGDVRVGHVKAECAARKCDVLGYGDILAGGSWWVDLDTGSLLERQALAELVRAGGGDPAIAAVMRAAETGRDRELLSLLRIIGAQRAAERKERVPGDEILETSRMLAQLGRHGLATTLAAFVPITAANARLHDESGRAGLTQRHKTADPNIQKGNAFQAEVLRKALASGGVAEFVASADAIWGAGQYTKLDAAAYGLGLLYAQTRLD